jgi:Na+/H+ antiporter NhaC
MDHIGILSLLPPIFVVIFAVKTKRIFETLILGTLMGLLLVYGTGAFGQFVDNIYVVLADADNAYLFSFILLFGGLILLIEKSRGLESFSEFLLKFCTTPTRTMIVTWLLGIIIFIDDSLNALAIGTTMRKVSDNQKVPREMLAYVTNSTGACVCTVIPLSSWVAFYVTVYSDYPELMALGSSPLNVYIRSIPFMLYPLIAIVLVMLVILGVVPKIGPMKKAYERLEKTGKVYSDLTAELNIEENIEKSVGADIAVSKGRIAYFVVPMLVLVSIAAYTQDLLISVIVATLTIYIMMLVTRTLSFKECSEALIDGMKIQFPVVLVIIGCFMFREAIFATGITNYIVETVGGILSPALLPAMAFVVVFCIVFASSTPWSLPLIAMAIFMPLAASIGANLLLTAGAIIAAGVGGAHACLYSDVDVIVAVGCKIDLLEHTMSQLPYCLIAAGISLAGYVALGILM